MNRFTERLTFARSPHDTDTVVRLVKFAVKVVFAAYVYEGVLNLVWWLAR